eukprot:gene17494-17690_t
MQTFACQAQVGADRKAVLANMCGDAGQMATAAQQFMAIAGQDNSDDVAWSHQILDAVLSRTLACSDTLINLQTGSAVVDAATLKPAVAVAESRSPVLSLKNRPLFEVAAALLTMLTKSPAAEQQKALKQLEHRPEAIPAALIDKAIQAAPDASARERLTGLRQAAALKSPDISERISAIQFIAQSPGTRALTVLDALRHDADYGKSSDFRKAVDGANADVSFWLSTGNILNSLYNGFSFASILFLAAIGLAIIFGLMGVINLAHGEFIMVGAYVTFLVQEAFRHVAPAWIDLYLIVAIPVVFGVTAVMGALVEQLLIRHFYTRPLMSLLATWAVSLLMVNLVRVIFGTQNLQFEVPAYLQGGIHVIGDFIITWNRLFAIGFATSVLLAVRFLLQKTSLGLNIRAVMLNRNMAGCIGIPTRKIDRMAFGLGAGLAGLAGLALSPIYNVNPQMGTQFIIDSFMVVVLGGVGTLMGTMAAAIGVGQINVLIEPIYGAVAAKVIVLVMIIIFLQWRPEGLFKITGRRK